MNLNKPSIQRWPELNADGSSIIKIEEIVGIIRQMKCKMSS